MVFVGMIICSLFLMLVWGSEINARMSQVLTRQRSKAVK